MFGKKTHPSFKETAQGYEYVPGQAKGNANYFEKAPPPVRDAATGHPLGSDGKIDWARVISESNQKAGGNG